MPQPNGYRKALRFMKHADHFGFPIITFVDTPGAYAGKNAEELGQVSLPCCTPVAEYTFTVLHYVRVRRVQDRGWMDTFQGHYVVVSYSPSFCLYS